MSEKLNGGLGLQGNFEIGEDNWGDLMNQNLRDINVNAIILLQDIVESPTAVSPIGGYWGLVDGRLAKLNSDGQFSFIPVENNYRYLNIKDGKFYHSLDGGWVAVKGVASNFLSVNGTNASTNYNSDGATGEKSIAIGADVLVAADGSLGIGKGITIPETVGELAINNVIIVGNDITPTAVSGINVISLGSGQKALATGSISVGNNIISDTAATEDGEVLGAITIGNDVENVSESCIVIGGGTKAMAPKSLGLGNKQSLMAPNTIAIGEGVQTSGEEMLIIGNNGTIDAGSSSVGVGNDIIVKGSYIVALGHASNVDANNTIAIGSRQKINGHGSIVIGDSLNFSGGIVTDSVILDSKQHDNDIGPEATLSKVVRFGIGNHSVDLNNTSHAQVALGIENILAGTFCAAVGINNKTDTHRSIAIGFDNVSIRPFSALVGHDNVSNPLVGMNGVKHFAHGSGNRLDGSYTWIGGVENIMNDTNTSLTERIGILGFENNISNRTMSFKLIGDNNTIVGSPNSIEDTASTDGVVIGNYNEINVAERGQIVIGNRVISANTASGAIVIGDSIEDVIHEDVVYLGNKASVKFDKPTLDGTLDKQFANSYLLHGKAYKLTALGGREYYTGNNILALAKSTIIANVGAGSDDDHAVNVKQLKQLAKIMNSDMSLYSKANKYACYASTIDAAKQDTVVWNVTTSDGVKSVLTTVAEKQAFITANFNVVETLTGGIQLLTLKGDTPIKFEYTQTIDSKIMEVVDSTLVINGGYSDVHGVSHTEATAIHSPYTGWRLNPALHQTTNAVFFVKPSTDGWGN